ncbi:hypothetical protein GOP47_0022879 [Adiantum capillus-veneris]|uniref:Smr domain-containing protein n=1 Tax=Adiantum capillus-veneris TaxID=13818 RepID=A0A9D4U739_ADICA|nr:hypothetical protein GOP47_0022879 [Adiantum capillus-veneris]
MALKLLPAQCCVGRVSYGTPSEGPSKAAGRLILQLRHSGTSLSTTLRRSVRHLPRPTLLATLRHLLHQHDWQLALPIYLSLLDIPWFNWNAELHAEIVALLTASEQVEQVQSLLEGLEEKLDLKQHMHFNRNLLQQYARFGLKDEMLVSYGVLQALTPPHAKGHSLSALLHAYASMDLPQESLAILKDMQQQGLKPSLKDFKVILFSLGKCGMFSDMEAFACEMEKLKLLNDPVIFNMIITTYATAENYDKVNEWLLKLLETGLKPSARSLNAVAKACRVLTEVASSKKFVKKDALLEYLKSQGAKNGELEVLKALLEHCLVDEVVAWDSNWELDVHSASIGSAYVMLCCWLEDVVRRLKVKGTFPSEVGIITGWGKHSETRGTSLIKLTIRDLLESVDGPFRNFFIPGSWLARRIMDELRLFVWEGLEASILKAPQEAAGGVEGLLASCEVEVPTPHGSSRLGVSSLLMVRGTFLEELL